MCWLRDMSINCDNGVTWHNRKVVSGLACFDHFRTNQYWYFWIMIWLQEHTFIIMSRQLTLPMFRDWFLWCDRPVWTSKSCVRYLIFFIMIWFREQKYILISRHLTLPMFRGWFWWCDKPVWTSKSCIHYFRDTLFRFEQSEFSHIHQSMHEPRHSKLHEIAHIYINYHLILDHKSHLYFTVSYRQIFTRASDQRDPPNKHNTIENIGYRIRHEKSHDVRYIATLYLQRRSVDIPTTYVLRLGQPLFQNLDHDTEETV